MNKIFMLLFLFLLVSPSLVFALPIKLMSFNIRYNNSGDGPNAWPNRKNDVIALIKDKYSPDLLGLQEVLVGQLADLRQGLGSEYDSFGVGRDDGAEKGEFNPIFYRKDRFLLIDKGTFWLAPNPDVPSGPAWDAACARIVTWGKFQERSSGDEFYYFNTHFDFRGMEAQKKSADLVMAKAQFFTDEKWPIILTGDFNLQEKSVPYAMLANYWQDARYFALTPHQGPTASFVADKDWTSLLAPETRIDYIWVKNVRSVLQHRLIDDKRQNGHYYSDHLPIFAELVIY